ncbi:MAG TPA: DUF1552 domain-containing protein [Polyangiaceae bacterium]
MSRPSLLHRPGFSRRGLLKSLGMSTALAPFLPILNASGQEVRRPKRLLLIFTPDGSADSDGPEGPVDWKPVGTETAFTLHQIHAPFEPLKSKIVIPWGLKMSARGAGEQHAYGSAGLWTGATLHDPQDGADFDGGNGHRTGWGSGPSVDQIVAAASGANAPYARTPEDATQETPYRTLELGVQCGQPHSVYRTIYKGDSQPLHPEVNPRAAFDRLFSGPVGDPAAQERIKAEQRSILDLVKGDLARLRTKISTEEAPKLDGHLEGLRKLEQRLDSTVVGACSAPMDPGTSTGRDNNANFPGEIASMLDIAVHALACDLTRVMSVQISRGFSNVTHTWLGHTTAHHSTSHENADNRDKLMAIDNWYMTHIAGMLGAMNAINEGNGTLLDNTLVVCGRELGSTSHRMQPMPLVMAGGAQGALRTGRFIDVNNEPHAKLLVSICRMMGLSTNGVGDINPDSGPLTKLA